MTDPVFIFGAARSGTSFFSRLLRDHFDCGIGPEAKFLVDIGRSYAASDSLSEQQLDALISRLLQTEMVAIVNDRYSKHFQKDMRINKGDVYRHLRGNTYPKAAQALLAAIGERMGKNRVANKYPDYWKHLPTLSQWYPQARFIHLLRDGRDVALSTQRMDWGAHTVYASACEWKRMLKRVDKFASLCDSSRFLTLRYEDLLQSPQVAYSRLSQFLDWPVTEPSRDAFLKELASIPEKNRYRRWPTQMSKKEQRLYEGIAGEQLLQSGYAIDIKQPTITLSEHAFYRAEDFGRRVWQKAHGILRTA